MGNKLFSQVTNLTGLPDDMISRELIELLENRGISPDNLDMKSLREALADYLADVAAQLDVTTESDSETEVGVELGEEPTSPNIGAKDSPSQ